jgi:hypothetical protein
VHVWGLSVRCNEEVVFLARCCTTDVLGLAHLALPPSLYTQLSPTLVLSLSHCLSGLEGAGWAYRVFALLYFYRARRSGSCLLRDFQLLRTVPHAPYPTLTTGSYSELWHPSQYHQVADRTSIHSCRGAQSFRVFPTCRPCATKRQYECESRRLPRALRSNIVG